MQWNKDAEEAVAKVPFFVRKRVKKRVETEAQQAGAGQGNDGPCHHLPATLPAPSGG